MHTRCSFVADGGFELREGVHLDGHAIRSRRLSTLDNSRTRVCIIIETDSVIDSPSPMEGDLSFRASSHKWTLSLGGPDTASTSIWSVSTIGVIV